MPTSLFIIGSDPQEVTNPRVAPWSSQTEARNSAIRLGFREQFFVFGQCHNIYDSAAVRRKDVGHEIGRKSVAVILAAIRQQPTILVLFGNLPALLFMQALQLPQTRDPWTSLSVTDRLHLLVLPDPGADGPVRDEVKRQAYREASNFLFEMLAEELPASHGGGVHRRHAA